MAFMNSRARSKVLLEVCSPIITSTPFKTGTGFMKWVDRTRSSAPFAAAAIFVIEIEEVFVANTASLGQIVASFEKISNLRLGIS